jgi:hypothetical protein
MLLDDLAADDSPSFTQLVMDREVPLGAQLETIGYLEDSVTLVW